MPIQATLSRPNDPAVIASVPRFFAQLAPRVWKLRGLGAEVPALLKLVFPFSITTRWPLYFTVPTDVISYTTWPWVQRHIIEAGDPIWVEIERQWDKTGLSAQWMLLAFGVETVQERNELEQFLQLKRQRSADGGIVVEIPQMWFRDP